MEPRAFSIELTPDELSHLIFAVRQHNIKCNFGYLKDKVDYGTLKITFELLNKIESLIK